MTTKRIAGSLKPTSWNPGTRTIDCVFSTGAGVVRRDPGGEWLEVLSMKPEHVGLARIQEGAAPVLNSHRRQGLEDQLGSVERAWFEGENLCATLKIGENPTARAFEPDIAGGVIRNISVGYLPRKYEEVPAPGNSTPTFRCVDWEIHEISFVPVGADPGAGTRGAGSEPEPLFVRRSPEPPKPPPHKDNDEMNERARIRWIQEHATRNGMGQEFILRHIDAGTSIEGVKDELLRALEERNSPGSVRSSSLAVGANEVDRTRSAVSAFLEERLLGKPEKSAEAARFRGRRMEDVARSLLESHGVSTQGMDGTDVAIRSFHSSSDFPLLLAAVVDKKLKSAYEEAPQTFSPVVFEGRLPDFKEAGVLQMSSTLSLQKKAEGGQMKHDTLTESQEKIKLETYAVSASFTREAMVNDDLGALERIPEMAARGARNLESELVWGIFKENPLMGDGKRLFSKEHRNLHAKALPLTVEALAEVVQAMRSQIGMDERERLNLTPATLIVPSTHELAARKLLTTNYSPQTPSDVNVFGGLIKTLIVEPRLDELGSWWVATDKKRIDLIMTAYLDGKKGLQMKTLHDDDRLAVRFNFHMDFGARPMDWRGFYSIPLARS